MTPCRPATRFLAAALLALAADLAVAAGPAPADTAAAAAQKKGVRVYACQNSMRGFNLQLSDLAPGVGVVPSGVVELIRRQHAGYAYVRS